MKEFLVTDSGNVGKTHLRSKSAIPLTRLWVYCTISENRKAYAESETSVVRVLLRCLSYTLGLGFPILAMAARFVVAIGVVPGNENRVELEAGEK